VAAEQGFRRESAVCWGDSFPVSAETRKPMKSLVVIDAIARQAWVPVGQHPLVRCTAAAVLALLVVACGTGSPTAGTQTHWLRTCELDGDCGSDLQCICGVWWLPLPRPA
jgi:hypothetical protein